MVTTGAGVVTGGVAAVVVTGAAGTPAVAKVTVPLLRTSATPLVMAPPELVAAVAESVTPFRVRL